MRATAFVFARGGSKGLPGKNLRLVGGVPLVVRAIQSAIKCSRIDRVFLSTDDERIAHVGLDAGAIVPELRPPQLAQDDSPEILAWQHALRWCETGSGHDFDCFVSVPPTAPLRIPEDLDAAIKIYERGDCESVITGSPARRHPAFNLVVLDDRGFVERFDRSDPAPARRQDTAAAIDLTTVAYVTSPAIVRQGRALTDTRCRLYEVPHERSIDIDDEVDLYLANCLVDYQPSGNGDGR